MAISYTVVSWLQLQVGDILFPAFGIPDEKLQILIIVLVVCFPGILILAWFYDIGPHGISRIPPTTGNGKKKSGKKPKPLIRPLTSNYFIATILLLLALQYVYFNFIQDDQPYINTELSADIRLNKIAIIPFEHDTDSVQLTDSATLATANSVENLGKIAANVITLGFTAFEDIPVTSPFTIENNLGSLEIKPGDVQGRPAFAELTGAVNIVTGSYKVSGEQIIFELRIQDVSTGEIKFIFPPIYGSVSHVQALLTELREKVLDYWVSKQDIEERLFRIPSYNAYEQYLNMLNEDGNYMKSLDAIVSEDSMFHLARIHVLSLTRWYADTIKIDHFDFLDTYRDRMTSYEGLWYDYVRFLYEGNTAEAYHSISRLREKFPGDLWVNHDAASVAYNELGNYGLSNSIYEENPIRDYDISQDLYGFSARLRNQIVNYAVLGEEDKLKSLMIETPRRRVSNYHQSLYSIMTGDNDAYHYWLKAGLKRKSGRSSNLIRRFAYDYRSVFSTNTMNSTLIYETASFLRSTNDTGVNSITLTRILDVLDDKVVSLDLEVTQETIFYAYWTALGLINNGDMEGVRQIIQDLEKLVYPEMSVTGSYQVYPYYVIGCIYAQMGEEGKAIRYLKKARNAGLFIGHYHFKYDKHLQSLMDNRRFRHLNEPVEP